MFVLAFVFSQLIVITKGIWQTMAPLYEKIHGYVRHKLRQHWNDNLGANDPIPAHILGNMWAQEWSNVLKIVTPFPNITNPLDEVNAALKNQSYIPRMIFELSNDFYSQLGLADMTMCFDTDCGTENTEANHECVKTHPMIEKPDWDVVCHASAWDMYHADKKDY